eukprot:Amastigsp_a14774_12.p3 type:complete len:182 gc:universal Amastigsp_a14774_12:716-171(-)
MCSELLRDANEALGAATKDDSRRHRSGARPTQGHRLVLQLRACSVGDLARSDVVASIKASEPTNPKTKTAARALPGRDSTASTQRRLTRTSCGVVEFMPRRCVWPFEYSGTARNPRIWPAAWRNVTVSDSSLSPVGSATRIQGVTKRCCAKESCSLNSCDASPLSCAGVIVATRSTAKSGR